MNFIRDTNVQHHRVIGFFHDLSFEKNRVIKLADFYIVTKFMEVLISFHYSSRAKFKCMYNLKSLESVS